MGDNEKSDLNGWDSKKKQDFVDLQNEIAGHDTGRMKRFMPKRDKGDGTGRNKDSRRETLSILQLLLLNDPEYATLYNDTNDLLTRAEIATEKALQQAEEDLVRAKETLRDTLDNANKLADGTAVFKDENGKVWTENERLVKGVELEEIVWKESDAAYEDYLEQKQESDETRQRIEDLRHYQVDVLGHARDRMNDQDDPFSKKELQEMQKEIYEQALPSIQSKLQPESTQTLNELSDSFVTAKPAI